MRTRKDDFIKRLERQALFWGWVQIITVVLGIGMIALIIKEIIR